MKVTWLIFNIGCFAKNAFARYTYLNKITRNLLSGGLEGIGGGIGGGPELIFPSSSPTDVPTSIPTLSFSPSSIPTYLPTRSPTLYPTLSAGPSSKPSLGPTDKPTSFPSNVPTSSPTHAPTSMPTTYPTVVPTSRPTTYPTVVPTDRPTITHSDGPTQYPTTLPTNLPSIGPTPAPSSHFPSTAPTAKPTSSPSDVPSRDPTSLPTYIPSTTPSSLPTAVPSATPFSDPSSSPSMIPTAMPNETPSTQPSQTPTSFPSSQPSRNVSIQSVIETIHIDITRTAPDVDSSVDTVTLSMDDMTLKIFENTLFDYLQKSLESKEKNDEGITVTLLNLEVISQWTTTNEGREYLNVKFIVTGEVTPRDPGSSFTFESYVMSDFVANPYAFYEQLSEESPFFELLSYVRLSGLEIEEQDSNENVTNNDNNDSSFVLFLTGFAFVSVGLVIAALIVRRKKISKEKENVDEVYSRVKPVRSDNSSTKRSTSKTTSKSCESTPKPSMQSQVSEKSNTPTKKVHFAGCTGPITFFRCGENYPSYSFDQSLKQGISNHLPTLREEDNVDQTENDQRNDMHQRMSRRSPCHEEKCATEADENRIATQHNTNSQCDGIYSKSNHTKYTGSLASSEDYTPFTQYSKDATEATAGVFEENSLQQTISEISLETDFRRRRMKENKHSSCKLQQIDESSFSIY